MYVENTRKKDIYICLEELHNIEDLASATGEFLSCVVTYSQKTNMRRNSSNLSLIYKKNITFVKAESLQ